MPIYTINILHFEDNAADAFFIREILSGVPSLDFRIRHVESLQEGLRELSDNPPDIILLDLNLVDSEGLGTFRAVRKVSGHVPIIIMSGFTDENIAVLAVKLGAQDYLIKGRVETDLLVRAIRYGIERQKLRTDLQQALEQIKVLHGLLPICAKCKDIRDDSGYWHQIEDYVRNHSDADFTHGICPECAREVYPELSHMTGQKKKAPRKKRSE